MDDFFTFLADVEDVYVPDLTRIAGCPPDVG
jgi:hypothetical protein